MQKALNRFRRGNGELVGFTVVAICICSLMILLFALLQLNMSVNEISKALTVACRSAAVCHNMDEASEQVQNVAENAIRSTNISDIRAEVEYVTPSAQWTRGTYINVTVSAYVQTLEPYFTSRTYEKKSLVVIEGGDSINSGDWDYTAEELDILNACVTQECDVSYEGALAVITCICNRADTNYAGHGTDPLSQLMAPGQFSSYESLRDDGFNRNVPDFVRQAVTAALHGARNHNFLEFRGYDSPFRHEVQIGGNYYFHEM